MAVIKFRTGQNRMIYATGAMEMSYTTTQHVHNKNDAEDDEVWSLT